jgi:uncharacterized 2Fe-2S/4Fe-4S cluster protein (DUF4445 family)
MATVEGDVTVHTLGTGRSAGRALTQTQRVSRVVAGVDLGTTTVAAQLVDADRRATIAASSAPNRQACFGADVLSRLSAAQGGMTEDLRNAARTSVSEVLDGAMKSADVAVDRLERIVIAANTVMASLFAGAGIEGLTAHPFHHDLHGRELLGVGVLRAPYEHVETVLVPPVAAFVGGDLTAGLMAEGLASDADGVLYADLGTNAEVAAFVGGRGVVASAPAGPAFEGWGIACGGQQGPGGLVAVRVEDDAVLKPVFEGESETHLTASGLISAVATLRRMGHLDEGGLMHAEGPLSERFFVVDDMHAVSLNNNPSDRSVYLSQLDVRALQAAKAAVAVGLRVVAAEAGLGRHNLREVVVVGAFGGAVDAHDLVDLGILPGCAGSLTRAAPDAAVRGAADIALDIVLMDDARSIAGTVELVDLAGRSAFTQEYIEAIALTPYDL